MATHIGDLRIIASEARRDILGHLFEGVIFVSGLGYGRERAFAANEHATILDAFKKLLDSRTRDSTVKLRLGNCILWLVRHHVNDGAVDRSGSLPDTNISDSLAPSWQERVLPAELRGSRNMSQNEPVPSEQNDVVELAPESKYFDGLLSELDEMRRPLIRKLQRRLESLAGKHFGSLESNRAFTRKLREILSQLNARVACGKTGCDQPSFIVCTPASRARNGSFQFQHSGAEGKLVTHTGSKALPRLHLVSPPADARRKANGPRE